MASLKPWKPSGTVLLQSDLNNKTISEPKKDLLLEGRIKVTKYVSFFNIAVKTKIV